MNQIIAILPHYNFDKMKQNVGTFIRKNKMTMIVVIIVILFLLL